MIHDSVREATDHGQAVRVQRSVSIHASAREATMLAEGNPEYKKFQSTPPRGRRLFEIAFS